MVDQRTLEGEMHDRGVQRHRRRVHKAREKKLESTTTAGRRLLMDASGHLELAIKKWVRHAKTRPGNKHRAVDFIRLLPANMVAGLTCRCVLDAISHRRFYTRAAMRVAAVVEDECRFRAFRKSDPGIWKQERKKIDTYHGYAVKRRYIVALMNRRDHEFPVWSAPDKMKVGSVLLELLIQSTGLVEARNVRNMFGKTQIELCATDETLRWIEQSDARAEILTPLYLPCVEPPKDWKNPLSGGFHSASLYSSAMVKTPDRSHIEDLAGIDLDLVYRSLNSLQRTAWRINSDVLEVFAHFWEQGYEAAGMPLRDNAVVPAKPADIADNEESRKAWRKLAREVHDANNKCKSKRLTVAKVLNVARKFEGKPMWFTHQLDWRGRAYPSAYHLHPQGPDYVKGLLEFNEGKPIGLTDPKACTWHSIHGANCWGLDKVPFLERAQWTIMHHKQIREVAADPLTNRWWEEADKPWQFLAWCLDHAAWLDGPDDYVSHLPIHQDATQSGIQIMSLLLRDEVGGVATNCVPSETPQDLYAAVAKEVNRLLLDDAGSRVAHEWLRFGIDRSCCKRPVMTRVYNATIHSCAKYVREWAEEKVEGTEDRVPEDGGSTYRSSWYLATMVWKAMDAVIASTARCQAWFRTVAETFTEHNLPMRWTTPVGLLVKQSYPKWNSKSVKTSIGDVIRQTSLRVARNTMDKRKMTNGLAPNVIHSLDAAAMMATVNVGAAAGITSFAAVHDSFATHAADSETLAAAIREAYVQVFDEDYLGRFKTELESFLPDGVVLPDVPSFGSLDVRALRDSQYFFN